jgi:hypothetical protein
MLQPAPGDVCSLGALPAIAAERNHADPVIHSVGNPSSFISTLKPVVLAERHDRLSVNDRQPITSAKFRAVTPPPAIEQIRTQPSAVLRRRRSRLIK